MDLLELAASTTHRRWRSSLTRTAPSRQVPEWTANSNAESVPSRAADDASASNYLGLLRAALTSTEGMVDAATLG